MSACPKCGKVCYPSREKALSVRRKIDRRQGIILAAYKCGRHWHLGNTPNTRLENMNRLFDKIHHEGQL